MTVVITQDPRFQHLGADRSLVIKVGGVGVEKEAVCLVVITAETPSSGVIVTDFTQVGFKQVYSAIVSENDDWGTNLWQFEKSGTNGDAALGGVHGIDLAGADTSGAQTVTMTVTIRGV